MADITIEWTDATWNPVRGCTKLTEPLSWKKPRRVFVNSMSDLFQDGVPDSFIDQVFAVMALCPQHTFQVLTKRADRIYDYVSKLLHASEIRRLAVIAERFKVGGPQTPEWLRHHVYQPSCVISPPPPNVWLGVSVENQHFADERIPLLLQTPAAVRFVSAEPLLGPVDLRGLPSVSEIGRYFDALSNAGVKYSDWPHRLDWVIVGGESGPSARPCDVAWVRSIRDQCQAAGVPVFIKQLGANPFEEPASPVILHSRKGGFMAEWPEDLRVREFPGDSCK